ncbi:MAG: hypothetical protein RL536_146 [Candidatus Parcubacteria bacterium]
MEEKSNQLTDLIINSKSDALRQAYEAQLEKNFDEIEKLGFDSVAALDDTTSYRTALEKVTGLLKSPYITWQKLDTAEQ